MVTKLCTGAILGVECRIVTVEVDVSSGLPQMEMVGKLSGEVREAEKRVRVALKNIGVSLPPRRITINLAPAALPKEGTAYDLPIAVALLAAVGLVPEESIEETFVAGELGLNGEIKAVRGVLPMLLAAREYGCKRCILPECNRMEAAVVSGIGVCGYEELRVLLEELQEPGRENVVREGAAKSEALEQEACAEESGRDALEQEKEGRAETACEGDAKSDALEREECAGAPGRAVFIREEKRADGAGREAESVPDYDEIYGQEGMKRAMVIAAAGFHNLLMVGPPGAGKTMAARRLPGILPPMREEERLEVSKIYSVAGLLRGTEALVRERPFVAPHHSATLQALAGGGRVPVPGLISRAHKGVLFLDEAVHFTSATLEVLRQPIEEKRIMIARSSGNYVFPADFMLVLALNPCPCGNYPDPKRCSCTEEQVRRYLSKLSGPLLDRIDLCIEMGRLTAEALEQRERRASALGSAQMREQVIRARRMQERRFAGSGVCFNAQLGVKQLEECVRLSERELSFMHAAYERMHLSLRSYHRTLRVARTIADLEEEERVQLRHLNEALCYRGIEDRYWRGGAR